MIRTISADEAHRAFHNILARVHQTDEAVILEQAGEPMAVLISPDTFRHLQQLQRQAEQAWVTIDEFRSRNAGKDPDEVLDDVTAIVEQIRQGRHARRTPADRSHR